MGKECCRHFKVLHRFLETERQGGKAKEIENRVNRLETYDNHTETVPPVFSESIKEIKV